MKKWIILVAVVWVMALASYLLIKSRSAETPIQALETENVRLRVIAENRELLWKITVLEEKLKGKPPSKAPTKIAPVPSGARVDITPK